MNVFHCLLSVLPSLSLHTITDRLESVWGFRFELKSVARMSAGILGWTLSVLWIVMGHSSTPALQFCQLVLSGKIFSYFFFCIPFTFAVILEGSWENLTVNTSIRPRWVMSGIILITWICLSFYMCTSLMSPVQTPETLGDTITLIM